MLYTSPESPVASFFPSLSFLLLRELPRLWQEASEGLIGLNIPWVVFFSPKVRFQLDQHVKCPSRRGGRDAVVQPASWQAVKCDECRVPEALAGRSTLTFLLE